MVMAMAMVMVMALCYDHSVKGVMETACHLCRIVP